MKTKTKDQIKVVAAITALLFLMCVAGTMDYQAAVEAESYYRSK